MADPVLAAAMALDAALGWPCWLYRRVGHPVGGFARIISASADILNRADLSDAAKQRILWQGTARLYGFEPPVANGAGQPDDAAAAATSRNG